MTFYASPTKYYTGIVYCCKKSMDMSDPEILNFYLVYNINQCIDFMQESCLYTSELSEMCKLCEGMTIRVRVPWMNVLPSNDAHMADMQICGHDHLSLK